MKKIRPMLSIVLLIMLCMGAVAEGAAEAGALAAGEYIIMLPPDAQGPAESDPVVCYEIAGQIMVEIEHGGYSEEIQADGSRRVSVNAPQGTFAILYRNAASELMLYDASAIEKGRTEPWQHMEVSFADISDKADHALSGNAAITERYAIRLDLEGLSVSDLTGRTLGERDYHFAYPTGGETVIVYLWCYPMDASSGMETVGAFAEVGKGQTARVEVEIPEAGSFACLLDWGA